MTKLDNLDLMKDIDTRGMLRQHQFPKVEMVSICRPEDSAAEHERMTECAERVLTELGLTWRRVLPSDCRRQLRWIVSRWK